MSGTYLDSSEAAKTETERQTESAHSSAMARAASAQREAGRFITENGHEVVSGHADVGYVPPGM